MWEQVFSFTKSQSFSSFVIDCDFNDSYLIVKSVCPDAKPDWTRAGYCSPLFNMPEVGLVYGKSESVRLGSQLIYFDNPLHQSFKLSFFIHPWLPTVRLSFYAMTSKLNDPGDRLTLLEQSLERIEAKIDTYSINN